MKPAQVHSWQLEKNTEGYVIEFEEELFKTHPSFAGKIQTLLQMLPDSFQVTDKKDFATLVELCQTLLEEYETKAADYELVTSLELFNFLIRLSRVKDLKLKKAPPMESFVVRFEQLIEAHFTRQHEVEFYAGKLGITAKALTMKMSRLTGKSARTLIQERVILEARRLLAYSEIPIAEISAQLGFEDANYFSRFFKLKTKHAPGTFRKKAKTLQL